MAKYLLDPVSCETYRLLQFGCKTLEASIGLGAIRRVKTGDEVSFECHEADVFDVVRTARYRSFDSMLEQEDYRRIMPGLRKCDVHHHFKENYTRLGEMLLGVYVIELRRAIPESLPLAANE